MFNIFNKKREDPVYKVVEECNKGLYQYYFRKALLLIEKNKLNDLEILFKEMKEFSYLQPFVVKMMIAQYTKCNYLLKDSGNWLEHVMNPEQFNDFPSSTSLIEEVKNGHYIFKTE